MSGLDQFKIVLKEFRSTMLFAVGGSALLPIMAAFAGLDPPWPKSVAVLTSLAILVAIIFAFQFLRQRPKRVVDRTMLRGLGLAIVAALIYFTILSLFVFEIPTTGERDYAGCGWTTNAATVASDFLADPADGCPGNYRKLLESAEYENAVIWTASSIAIIRMAALASWIALFVGISLITAAFITFQAERK